MIKKVKKLVKDFGLGELRTGLKVTGKEFVNNNITVQFPEERTPISPRFRGLHALRRYTNGEEGVSLVSFVRRYVQQMP